MKVTLNDCREVHYCTKGIRLFFKKHDLDFMDFCRNGIEASELEALNDSMANKILENVHGRR